MATVNVSWCLNAFILFTYATSGANELGAGNGRRARFAMIISVIESLITGVAIGSGWQSFVAYINLGIWAGMIFGGTAIQTLILIFIVTRCDWDKETSLNGHEGEYDDL
uniref:117M18_22 n=1 Tax=Brassica campestris TaxID=3711 RepID=Q4ABZ8_BRACM|nr:117M18_22 [Brassica rapa]